jgi:hypothetical protein
MPDGLRNASAGDAPRADRIIRSARRFVIPGEAGRASAPGTRDLAADIVPQPIEHGGSFKAGLLWLRSSHRNRLSRIVFERGFHHRWPIDN